MFSLHPQIPRMTPGLRDDRVVVALGANLGDRLANLVFGMRRLAEEGFRFRALSSVVETPAIGYEDQPSFFNMVVVGSVELGPMDLLAHMQSIERQAGRTRDFANAPRTLDLDLVFFKGRIVREPGLRVPHPRWRERSFVVQPLRALTPQLVDPETGLTVEEVDRIWPQEPKEIVRVHTNDEVLRALAWRGERT